MTALRRVPGLFGGIALASLLSAPIAAQDVEETFARAVDLLEQGLTDDALIEFKKVLSQDPDAETAYQLWRTTEPYLWTDLLVQGGEAELVAKRMMALARDGKQAHRNDPDEIRPLVQQALEGNIVERKRAVVELRSNHGEYAVPSFVAALGDASNDDRRLAAMTALIDMGDLAVAPLVEVLQSEDRTQRLSAVQTLARIADPRAMAMLAHLAATDTEAGIRQTAAASTGDADAGSALLELGWGYATESSRVLPRHLINDVVWDWNGRALEGREIPRFLYAGEMARKAFYAAMSAGADATQAAAGLSYVGAVQAARALDATDGGGELDDAVLGHVESGRLSIFAAGAEPANLALEQALREPVDVGASVQLCRALAELASTPASGLNAALAAGGGLAGEAAVALASIAQRSHVGASTAVVQSLGNAVARETVRVAIVIDGSADRRSSMITELEAAGFAAQGWASGGSGLAALSRLPGLDVLFVADSLPDLTTDQVVDEVASSPRLGSVPIVVVSNDPDTASDIFGEKAAMVVDPSGMDFLSGIEDLTSEITGDRARAEALAAKASSALAMLAGAGATDLSTVADVLASVASTRSDEVAIPALHALASSGATSAQLEAVVGVLTGEGSDELRTAAGNALAGMLGNNEELAQFAGLRDILSGLTSGDGSLAMRQAAASALGSMGSVGEVLQSLRMTVNN